MVLSAVVTTSASSAAMKEATEVSASTAAFADLALVSVMTRSLVLLERGRRRRTYRRRPAPLGTNGDGQRIPGQFFFVGPNPSAELGRLQRRQAVVGIGDVPGAAAGHVCVARMTGPQPREHADEKDPRALQDETGPGGGERAPDRAGVSGARAKSAHGRSLP